MTKENSFLYYDGARRGGTSNTYFDNIDPAKNKIIHTVQAASHKDVEMAVESAAAGFKIWSSMSPTERGRILRKAADLLRSKNEEIAIHSHLYMITPPCFCEQPSIQMD